MRRPRRLKKAVGKVVICYDLATVPNGADIQEIMEVFQKTGIIYYDGYNGGNPPQLLSRGNKRIKIKKWKR